MVLLRLRPSSSHPHPTASNIPRALLPSSTPRRDQYQDPHGLFNQDWITSKYPISGAKYFLTLGLAWRPSAVIWWYEIFDLLCEVFCSLVRSTFHLWSKIFCLCHFRTLSQRGHHHVMSRRTNINSIRWFLHKIRLLLMISPNIAPMDKRELCNFPQTGVQLKGLGITLRELSQCSIISVLLVTGSMSKASWSAL